MSMPGMGELVIIFFIILVVFGAGKIPKIAKDVGSGIRLFKKSLNDDEADSESETKSSKKKSENK